MCIIFPSSNDYYIINKKLVMFTIDDDFDLDEDFLKGAFEVESQAENKLNTSHCNNPTTSKRLCEKNETLSTRIQEKNTRNNNSEFINLWNANEGKHFFSKSPEKFSNPKHLLDTVRAVSPVGVRSEVVTRTPKDVRRRKFPGPAGLLPERTSNTSLLGTEEYISNIEEEDDSFSHLEGRQFLSQATNEFFEHPDSAWRNMMDDLGPQGIHLISTINLGSVKMKHAKFGFKVPFLAVCIENIDCSLPDPSLHLKDKIDEIYGTLHRDVWKEWKGELVVGSVLVLRNTGVICTGNSPRRFFLNITANNIITIYTPKHDSGIKIIKIQAPCGLNASEVLEEWERVMTRTRQQQSGNDPPQGRPLFHSFSSGSPLSLSSNISSSPLINRPFTPPSRPNFRPRIPLQQQRPPCISSPVSQYGIRGTRPPPNIQQNSPFAQIGPKRTPFNDSREMNQGISLRTNEQQRTPMSSLQAQPSFPLRKPVLSSPNSSNGIRNDVFHQVIGTPKTLSNNPSTTDSINNASFNSRSSVEPTVPFKKPKMSNEIGNQPKPSSSGVFSVASPADQSVVDSVLDGIDTDLFFDDF